MGFLILFTNQDKFFNVPVSVLVLALHIGYIAVLIVLNPYQMSLNTHTVGLFTCQMVYAIFLIFINIINFVDSIDEIIVLILGYIVLTFCFFIILFTAIRLYYEFRYG